MRADDLLRTVDRYLDAVPRSSADIVPIGPFSVFVTRGPWGFYARPTLPVAPSFSADEVSAVVLAQQARGQAIAIEWLAATAPTLAGACVSAGLVVTERPLLLYERGDPLAPSAHREFVVEVLSPTSPHLVDHRRVASVAFAHGGTAIGDAGCSDRDAAPTDPVAVEWSRSRIAAGLSIAVVARDADAGVVGVGSAQPVTLDGGIVVAELVGIAVLPTHRRRGIAHEITRVLVQACEHVGVQLLLLSAADDDVARVYEKVGFRRFTTFAEAAPAQ
jgi:GNAT superfamily N-acetyltransferase